MRFDEGADGRDRAQEHDDHNGKLDRSQFFDDARLFEFVHVRRQ